MCNRIRYIISLSKDIVPPPGRPTVGRTKHWTSRRRVFPALSQKQGIARDGERTTSGARRVMGKRPRHGQARLARIPKPTSRARVNTRKRLKKKNICGEIFLGVRSTQRLSGPADSPERWAGGDYIRPRAGNRNTGVAKDRHALQKEEESGQRGAAGERESLNKAETTAVLEELAGGSVFLARSSTPPRFRFLRK